MNDQRVKTDNEVIAEFMGFSCCDTGQDRFWNPPTMPPATVYKWKFHSNHLNDFQTSWDWLMPVVEKIEHEGYVVDIWKNICLIKGINHDSSVGKNKIDAVYQSVVSFIHWYQKQKSS